MNKSKKAARDLTTGPVFKTLLIFSLPIVATNMLTTAYGLVDMAIVGMFLGSEGLSAVSIVGDVMNAILIASNGMGSAAQVIIAQYIGANDRASVNKSVGTMFVVMMSIALAVTTLLLIFNKAVLNALNVPPEAWDGAFSYATVSYVGIIFTFGYSLLSSMLRGMGNSKHPMIFILVSTVSNIVLDYIFVGPMHMGTFGAALATVLSQGLSFVWALVYIFKHQDIFGLSLGLSMFRVDRGISKKFIRLAIPMSMQLVLTQVANLYVNSFINRYGVTVSAVSGVGNKLGTLAQVFSNGMRQGGGAMVGQNMSANKLDRVKKVIYINMVYGLVAWVILSGFTIVFREQMFGLFSKDPLVIEMSKAFMPALLLRYLTFFIRCSFMALINGIGNPKLNYLIGIVDGLVLRVGCSLFMGLVLGMGVNGFWYGNAIGGISPLFIGGAYFFSGRWKNSALIASRKDEKAQ